MTETVRIGALRESDAARCAALELRLFPGDDPWSERAFREELRAGHHYLAARIDPAGSAGREPMFGTGDASAARTHAVGRAGGAPTATARSSGRELVATARSIGAASVDTVELAGLARTDAMGAAAAGTGTVGGADAPAPAPAPAPATATAPDTAPRLGAPRPHTTEDGLVGYGGLAFVAGPPRAEAEIHTIGVDPAFQRRGIGRALLRGLLAVADAAAATVFLEVRTDNAAARGLYESEGFTVIGLRRRYYHPSGADAHTMRRDPR